MLDRVDQILRTECDLDPGAKLIVGVSGGPDSLCLLHLLTQLDYSVVVAHLNHGLRPEAESDADFVKAFSNKLGVKYYSDYQDTRKFAEAQGMTIEEAARSLRYTYLFSIAEKENARVVLVGHNADDQVETVLMHLLRGAGLSGLRGMAAKVILPQWHERIPVVRPLLGIWREEILSYCQENKLEPRFDRSNLDTTFFRNRLRQELIPELESYNPQVRRQIWRMASTLQSDYEIVENAVDVVWGEWVESAGDGFIQLSLEVFSKHPVGIQRGIVRRAISGLRPGLRDIDFEAVERVLSFVQSPPSTHQRDLIAGLKIFCEREHFWIANWDAEIATPDWPQMTEKEIAVNFPGETEIGEEWALTAEIFSSSEALLQEAMHNTDPFVGWMDVEMLGTEVAIRVMKAGDRFSPLGMGEKSSKLADFFTNVKLPRRARNAWPLICSHDKIAWVPGYRIGHGFRITSNTTDILKLHLYKTKKSN